MYKWLALLALVVILAWQLVDRSNDAHTAQPKSEKRETPTQTQPTVAGPAESDAGERAPTVEREPRSVTEPAELSVAPKQTGRVLVRARLGAPPPARFAEQRLQWFVDADAGDSGSCSRVEALVGEAVEVDLTNKFAGFFPAPTRVLVRALDMRFDSEANQWRNEESSVEFDLSDVPSRLRTEGSVTLDAVLDPLRISLVRGSLACGGGELAASFEWRLVRRHGEQWVREAGEFHPLLRCGATFAIPARAGGAVEWLVRVNGFLPSAGRLETPSVGVYELGILALTRGERVAGRVSPSAPGMTLRAICKKPTDAFQQIHLRWAARPERGDDPDLLAPVASVDPGGHFEFTELFPTDYRIELHRAPGMWDLDLELAEVRAPAGELNLTAPFAIVELQVVSVFTSRPPTVEVRLPDGGGGYHARHKPLLDKNRTCRVFVRVGQLHEFVYGERVVPVLVNEVGAVIQLRL